MFSKDGGGRNKRKINRRTRKSKRNAIYLICFVMMVNEGITQKRGKKGKGN